MDEATFREMCVKHDVTYQYANGPTYQRGKDQLDKINVAAKLLPEGAAIRIWNEVIDTKMLPQSRRGWYWRVK